MKQVETKGEFGGNRSLGPYIANLFSAEDLNQLREKTKELEKWRPEYHFITTDPECEEWGMSVVSPGRTPEGARFTLSAGLGPLASLQRRKTCVSPDGELLKGDDIGLHTHSGPTSQEGEGEG